MIEEKIEIFKDAEKLSIGFTQFLQKLLEVYPHINISLSGGSTPTALFDYWAENCMNSIDWKRISFFWGDERCVSPENEMSNFGMTQKHLFSKVSAIPSENIHRIHGENIPEKEAYRYSTLLNDLLFVKNGIPSFELILLGMGDDGHTASIFPNQIDLWNSKENCVVAEHPETKMKRISLSGKVINKAQHVVFLVTGGKKAEKIRDIIKNKKQFNKVYPAAKVEPEGYLYWFLDESASRLLK